MQWNFDRASLLERAQEARLLEVALNYEEIARRMTAQPQFDLWSAISRTKPADLVERIASRNGVFEFGNSRGRMKYLVEVIALTIAIGLSYVGVQQAKSQQYFIKRSN